MSNARTQALLALAGGAQITVEPAPLKVQPQAQVQAETRARDAAEILLVHDNADLAVQTRESKHQWRWIYSAGIPSRAIEEWYQMPPHARLLDPAVKVIVPTGNVALRELTGQKSVAQCRGSVYQWEGKWVIPALSPLVVKGKLKSWERRCYLDWQRIASFLQADLPLLPQPQCVTSPTSADVEWLREDMVKTGYLSLDIETLPSEGKMLCVGFSASPERALCLEWTPEWLPTIRELCQSATVKVLWNHSYDLFWLATEQVPVFGRIVDGMLLLHTLMPTDNVGLAYAASTESLHPYWKDLDKTQDDKTYEENWDQFKRYNCLDALVALEVTLKLKARVEAEGLWNFYVNHYEALYQPMLDIMLEGVEIDHTRRKELLKTYQAEAIKYRDALMKYNGGEPLFTLSTQRDQRIFRYLREGKNPYDYVNPAHRERETAEVTLSMNRIQEKTVSNVKLKHLIYTQRGVPPQVRRRAQGEETESVDIFALRQIANDYRHDPDLTAICNHALQHTRFQKLSTFLYDNRYDEDGRMRFALKFLTEIGRLASSASPRGRKVNSQNIPREKDVRSLILPEKGHVCLQADLSAAEARVCFVLTRDPELVALARKPSTEYDQHRHTAVIVGMASTFDETPENMASITKDQRQVGKVVAHSSQRAAQAFTISQTLLRNNQKNQEGNLFSEAECDAALTRYHRRFPAIRYWHARVRSQVRRHRMLVNTWGRRWPVPYDYFSDELWRRAYSVSLASEIADLLNQWGFRAVHEFIRLHKLHTRVMLQEHDGLVLSCPVDEVYDIAAFLRSSLEQERDYFGISLSIPVEFQVGRAWGVGEEWKSFPTREEMEAVARTAVG